MKPFESLFLFPLLTAQCPHCYEATRFGLAEHAAYLTSVIGVGVGRMVEYLILCGNCGYKEYVNKEDLPTWTQLADRFKDLAKGSISEEEFSDYVSALELPELKNLLAAGATWNCSCGENNPPNFAVCWKCDSPNPSEPTELNARPVDIVDWQPWRL